MNIFKWRKIALFLLYGGIVSICCALLTPSVLINVIPEAIAIFLLYIGIGLAGVSAIISFIFWRCPNCGKSFGVRHSNMEKINSCPFGPVKKSL